MPYLAPHFDPDVFVSYSHGPMVEDRAPLRDWTQSVIRRLRYLLSLDQEFDGLRLWMDPQIDPTAFLSDDLKTKASACGVLMIVMSGRYLESSWCQVELEWFKQQARDRAGAAGRIFVLRAQKTDTSLWPDFLRDARGHPLPGFSFYDPETGKPWDYPDLKEPNADFAKELSHLHTWLVARLRELRDRAAKRSEVSAAGAGHAAGAASVSGAAPAPTHRRIYLHAPPECEPARREIGLALKSDGFIPIAQSAGAGTRLADWQHEAKQLRLEAAKRCEALALLRVDEGEDRFVGDLLDIGVDECERIAIARGAPFPCAVLDKTGEGLPIDVSWAGIERFDLNQTDWPGRFRSWLDASRPSESGAF